MKHCPIIKVRYQGINDLLQVLILLVTLAPPWLGALKAEEPLASHLEGLGCAQGGLVDLPQPFYVSRASHPLLPRQNSAAASYAPAVKKPLRKLTVAERLRSCRALGSSTRASDYFLPKSICRPEASRQKKALPESREALQRTLKSFERSAVLSARCTRLQPLSTTVKDRMVMDCRASKKAHPVSEAGSLEQLAG